MITQAIGGGFDPRLRGFHAVYRDDAVNYCPGCGRTSWLIGRLSAECAFCGTALPLAASLTRGIQAPVVQHGRRGSWAA